MPRKNLALVGGAPLVSWPIRAAQHSESVDRVVVSTDDAEIAEAAKVAGAEVPFMRPKELAGDTASSMGVVLHALDMLEAAGDAFEYVALLEPTSPLTEGADVDAALRLLHAARDRVDAIVGVSQVCATHPEYDVILRDDGVIRPYAVSDFASMKRRQEISELYFLEGSLYVSAVAAFRQSRTFYHDRTMGYVVPRWKSFEVDDHLDLIVVEALLARRDELAPRE